MPADEAEARPTPKGDDDMVNLWKVSTLALAGALALVVGQGAVRSSAACEGATSGPTAEELTQIRLTSALSLLDKAEQQIKAAPAARAKPRAAALQQIALARTQVKKALEPEVEPRPVPRPKPMTRAEPDKQASLGF
jgi:hypothetical protein